MTTAELCLFLAGAMEDPYEVTDSYYGTPEDPGSGLPVPVEGDPPIPFEGPALVETVLGNGERYRITVERI